LGAGDVDQRLAVAGRAAVVGDPQRQAGAGDVAAACDEEEVARLAAAGADRQRGERGERGRRRARHAATAAPPRRGSPAPESAPLTRSRSTACAPPKNRLRSRKASTSRPAARSASTSIPGST